MKDTFSYSHIFRGIRLDHLIILSLIELELKVESKIFWSRLSIDLMIVFFTPHLLSSHLDHFFWIVDRNSLVIFVVVSHWTLM